MATSRAVATRRLSAPEPADEILALRSTWSGAVLGKSFHAAGEGLRPKAGNYRAGIFFVPEVVPVRGIRDMHDAWKRMARERDVICVRGGLSGAHVPAGTRVGKTRAFRLECGHVTRRTSGTSADGHPAGLVEAAHRWLFLDMDKVPNIFRLDPRTAPDAVMRFLLGLLPAAIRDTTVSWSWSSSMCVGLPEGVVPDCLSAHIRIWLDAPLDRAATRTLLERLREHAWLRLRDAGIERQGAASDNLVDWKVSEPQQPMYVAAPGFDDGIEDPFPGDLRWGLLDGAHEVVGLAHLGEELDRSGAAIDGSRPCPPRSRPIRRTTKDEATADRRTAARVRDQALVPGKGAEVLPFSTLKRMGEAATDAGRRKANRKWSDDRGLFVARAHVEIVRLVRGRVELGATDRRWKAWHDAGGVPEGARDQVLFLTGCLVAESLGEGELTDEKVNGAVLEIGRLIVAGDWLEQSWLGGRYWTTLVARAAAAGRGESEVWQGEVKDPRYLLGKARLLRELDVLPDEVLRYGLISVATDRDRLTAKRRREGATSRVEVQEKNLGKAVAAQRLVAEGGSLRAAARKVGIDEAQLRRLLASQKKAGAAEKTKDLTHSCFVPTDGADIPSTSRDTGREVYGAKEGAILKFIPSHVPARTGLDGGVIASPAAGHAPISSELPRQDPTTLGNRQACSALGTPPSRNGGSVTESDAVLETTTMPVIPAFVAGVLPALSSDVLPREEIIRKVLSELAAMAAAARCPGAMPGAPPSIPPRLGNAEVRRALLDVSAAYADASRREEQRASRREAAARAQDMRRRAREDLAGAWSWFREELDFLDLCWSDREKDASERELVYLRVQRKATFGARWRQWRAAYRAARGGPSPGQADEHQALAAIPW